MATYLSPGVYSIEKDISDLVPGVSTTVAGLVGWSAKGDDTAIRLITNKQQFINEYGEPDNTDGNYFHYTALAFLSEGNALWCYRVHDGAEHGGLSIGVSSGVESGADNETFIDTSTDFDTVMDSGYTGDLTDDNCLFMIFGKDPGTWNARIGITIDKLKNDGESWDSGAPTGVDDDIAIETVDQYTFRINVYYENDDGDDELVETWIVSRKHKTDGYGKQLYLEDKINGYSSYIYVQDNTALANTYMPDGFSTVTNLGAGDDGTTYTSAAMASAIATGWDKFANPSEVSVNMLLNGGETTQTVQEAMKDIAEGRDDCIAILDVDYDTMGLGVSNIITWRKGTATCNINSSYCAMYGPWLRVNDPYNDALVYVPPSGYVGAQFAYNDRVSKVWNAPAGLNRGIVSILGIQDVFTEGERDLLYEAQINPIQSFTGEGDVIWGQKTMQVKSSALSRVNVRRSINMMKTATARSLRPFLFENNNELTRFRINAMLVEAYDLWSSQGAFQTEAGDKGYLVVVDETNNTAAVIDRQELHVDIFVKPARAAEFIQLQTIITSTGASFNELLATGVNL